MFTQRELVAQDKFLNRFALKLTRNTDDAHDLVQSTYLRALEKKFYFIEGSNLQHWSSKIMYNLFVSAYRRKMKFEAKGDPDIHINRLSVAPTQEMTTEVKIIKKFMEKLDLNHRRIITMICFNEMSYQEAAEALHLPLGTIRSRLFRALEHLNGLMDNSRIKSKRAKQLPLTTHNIIDIKNMKSMTPQYQQTELYRTALSGIA